MNNNQRYNQAATKKYRKELQDMLEDTSKIDAKVLTRAVNEGLADVKRNTPVGHYSRTAYLDPFKEYKFNTRQIKIKMPGALREGHELIRVGGFLRKSWHSPRIVKTSKSVTKELMNSADYASYVNDGHRVVVKGVTVGFVKGRHMLEKAISKVNKAMVREFGKEVERVNKEHDKSD